MALYAISDLHLAFNLDKPMGIFGDNWLNHEQKIKENWISKITDKDTVLIAGDISWAMKKDDSNVDLNWIEELPGNKIISKGNHDYWWTSISKLNQSYKTIKFIQNNYFIYDDYAICGTRGWVCPGADKFTEKDEKIYLRELIRLKLSLDMAKKDGYENIIVMLHFPPISEKYEESGFVDILKEYNINKVIYGHIHGKGLLKAIDEEYNGINYIMTSADYLDFNPRKILE